MVDRDEGQKNYNGFSIKMTGSGSNSSFRENGLAPAPKSCHREGFPELPRGPWIRRAYRFPLRLQLVVNYAVGSGSGHGKRFRLRQLLLRLRIPGANRLKWH